MTDTDETIERNGSRLLLDDRAGCRPGEHGGLANAMRWRISSPISRGKAQAWRGWRMCAPR